MVAGFFFSQSLCLITIKIIFNLTEWFHLLLHLLLLLLQGLVTSQSDHHPGCRLQLSVPEKYSE